MPLIRLLAAASLFLVSVQPVAAQLRADLVTGGLSLPVAFVQDPSQPNVQVVVEQAGRVRVVQNGVLLAQDFLDLTSQVMNSGERGLLGLAFAPDYASTGRVYVQFTNLAGDTVVARFLRDGGDPLRADPGTRFDLVWPDGLPYLRQPFEQHKGGNLMFGPDGYLYLGLGDGGDQNDPFHLAQNPDSLLGKMLRIDVSVDLSHPIGYVVPPTNPFVGQPGMRGEIWSIGLRNPWRWSFDDPARGGTGALIIADVGEAAWEEVNYEPAGRSGRNYGWRNREGARDNVLTLPPYPIPFTDPIFEYSHDVGRSITGGFVYRGNDLGGGYNGRYFFADIVRSRVWSLGLGIDPGTGEATAIDVSEHTAELGNGARQLSSFGVDGNGELYLVSYGRGEIYRLGLDGSQPPPPPPPPSSCTTVQPGFGWVCANGNWYPPGMPIPGDPPPPPDPDDPPPPPTPPPDPNDPPTPPPPPTGSACTTIQPGPSWTCADGNWYPPGMTIPGAPPAPPPPPPPGPPSGGGCITPDPFVEIPGLAGICINGNWIPTEVVSGEATVRWHPEEMGFWAIEFDGGGWFVPLGGLDPSFQIDGLRVSVTAKKRLDLISVQGPIIELITISLTSE